MRKVYEPWPRYHAGKWKMESEEGISLKQTRPQITVSSMKDSVSRIMHVASCIF